MGRTVPFARSPETRTRSSLKRMRRFEGRVAIVTGAASGIGRATAERLTDEGAIVVAVDVAKDGPAETVGDVSDPAFVSTLIADTVDRHGRLDVLANVAG